MAILLTVQSAIPGSNFFRGKTVDFGSSLGYSNRSIECHRHDTHYHTDPQGSDIS